MIRSTIGTGRKMSIRNLINIICELMELLGKLVWQTDKLNSQYHCSLDAQGKLRAFCFTVGSDFKKGLKNVSEPHSIEAV
jgi:GDP-L-fucose synthase